jgi:hypothetical protein
MARYHAEYILRGRGFQNSAAAVGTICHGTLEDALRIIYILRTEPWSEDLFLRLYEKNYEKEIGNDKSRPEYEDGKQLVLRWINRPDQKEKLDSCRIASLEAKNNFPVKTSAGPINFNYIMDRLDQTGDKSWRVVDYKSNRVPLTAAQLRKKPQARLYALAVQILHKDAEEIWVEFDFLRHSPISVLFTKQDNIETWNMLRAEAQRIVDTPDSRPPETLNSECIYCVRKSSCKTLANNANAGGVFAHTIDDLAAQYALVKAQQSGQQALLEEIEGLLLAEAVNLDMLEIDTDHANITVTGRVARDPQHGAIGGILGPDLAMELAKFRAADVDKVIKDGRVSKMQADLLKMAMPQKVGEMGIKVELKEV